MGIDTKIQWTDHTFNPWWGCQRISPARLTQAEERRVIERYGAGETFREIGTSIGRSKTTIQNVLRRHGIDTRQAAARDSRGSRNPHWKGGTYIDRDGYVWQWTPDGHKRQHRLVTNAPPGTIVHHVDHDRANNDPANLEVLPSHAVHRSQHVAEERARDGKARHPPALPGEAHPRAVLTEAIVREVRALRGQVSQRELGIRFGVSKTAIRLAQQGKNWACVREFPEVPRG